jgi:hypothetical protein
MTCTRRIFLVPVGTDKTPMHYITISVCDFLENASSRFVFKQINLLFYQKRKNNLTFHFSCS